VANISAKHEGGDVDVEPTLAHPSDLLDYFRDKSEVISSGDWEALKLNFLKKVESCNQLHAHYRERTQLVAPRTSTSSAVQGAGTRSNGQAVSVCSTPGMG
jgi:hypothetical protein